MLPEGCTDEDGTKCQDARGAVFDTNKSTTWDGLGLFTLGLYEEKPLGYEVNGSFGYDDVRFSIDGASPSFAAHQVVEGFAAKDFYVGLIGLSGNTVNISDFQNGTDSFLTALKKNNSIPSRSWGYTAGASYAEPPAFGSLTLGGYDSSRFTPSSVSFPFGPDIGREFFIYLHSITSNSSAGPDLSSPTFITLNSLVPHIWLPEPSTSAFEKAFNLSYNETSNKFYIPFAAHEANLAANPTVTFTLSPGKSTPEDGRVNITLPYASFTFAANASALPPVAGAAAGRNRTHLIFPLKKAENTTQCTLGRTFFQNAYLTADWDRRNFSLAQAVMPDLSTQQAIVPILPNVTATSADGDAAAGSRKLSTGAMAGVGVGVAVLAIATAVLVWWVWRKRKAAQKTKEVEKEDEYRKAELSASEVPAKVEMEGSEGSDGTSPGGTEMGGAGVLKSELAGAGGTEKAELLGHYGGGVLRGEMQGDEGMWRGEMVGNEGVRRVELQGSEGVWRPDEKGGGGKRGEMDAGHQGHEADGGVTGVPEADGGVVGAEAEGDSEHVDSGVSRSATGSGVSPQQTGSGVSPEQSGGSGGDKRWSWRRSRSGRGGRGSRSGDEPIFSAVSPTSPPRYQLTDEVGMDTGTGNPDTLKELAERARRESGRR